MLSALALLVTSGVVLPAAGAAPASAGEEDRLTRLASTAEPCPMRMLAAPPGTLRAAVTGSDPTGRFQVGYAWNGTGNYRLVRWTDGVPQDLGAEHGGAGNGINVHGHAVGYVSEDATGKITAWSYRGTGFSKLPGLSAEAGSLAFAINAGGTVAGASRGANGDVPVTWTPDGSVRQLALPPGHTRGQALGIDDDGTVVGWSADQGPQHAVRWLPNGVVEQLPQLQPGNGHGTTAASIRGGHIIGQEIAGTTVVRTLAVVWRKGAATAESLGEGEPQAVNPSGAVVVRPTPDVKLRLIEPNGTVRALPTDTTPYPTGEVTALTDDGVAYGRWNSTPVSWDCRTPRTA
ncbi:hypothetical protein [Streptomyces sp. NPDC047315]|uniref:hypothetical protein n=1 Tax=Streptomyces sp. NPDC047315 TaxID=3155142 RepID=UPI0033EF04B6